MTAGSVDFRLLGHLEAVYDGETLQLGGPKHRTLLATLLLHANEPVAVDVLAEALWPERPPEKFDSTIQVYVSQLRRELGREAILRRGAGYVLAVESRRVDVLRFERLAADGRDALAAGEPERAHSVLAEALALWRGPALADFRYDAFALPHAERLEELRLAVLEARVDADLALGRGSELVPELQALIAEHPLRERLRGQLMLALYRSGRQAEALAAYQSARKTLIEELGLDPSPDLKELHRLILGQDAGLAAPDGERRPAPAPIPAPASPLVGRERELVDVTALLQDHRLVTLTGPGGTGKTRLALAVAAESAERFADGAAWVPLESVRDPELVLPAIAQALRIDAALTSHLADRRVLLSLDNLEQVVDAGPELGRLLAACPGLSILATSREPLHVQGEREFAVPPLTEADAVALFLERAPVAEDAEGAVIEICRRLDCLPLAVELAAARMKALTADQVLARLDRRLSLLTAGSRDAPGRQQTLRAAIDWSHELLGEQERTLFARLAVFSGGCTLEAAEGVVDADLDTLQALVERSLLRRDGDRFRMLETIREYASERLAADEDEAERLQRRHAEHYLGLAEEWAAGDELGNLRAALAWALAAREPALALQLAVAFARAADSLGLISEARLQLDRALSAPDGANADLRLRALSEAAAVAVRAGDHERGSQYAEEQLSVARESGNPRQVVSALCNLVNWALEDGDERRAAALAEEAVDLAASADDEVGLLNALAMQGLVELTRGRPETAVPLFERTVELARRVGRRRDAVATAIFNGALARHLAGDDARASELLEESLGLYREFDHVEGLGYCFELKAALAASAGRPADAAHSLGVAEVLLAQAGAALEPVERQLHERTLADVTEALGADETARLRAEGATSAAAATTGDP